MTEVSLQIKAHELRELLNSSIRCKQRAWNRKDNGDWSKLWTAVDNIEDTQLAIDEYSGLVNFSRLAAYGLLQAMVVQQDAISHLEEALQIDKPNWPRDYPQLSKIREIRRETVGHPTETKKKGGNSYTSVAHTNKLDVLEYGVWLSNNFEYRRINLQEIIKIQHDLLVTEIERIIQKVRSEESAHKKQFQHRSLSDVINATNYSIQKLWPFEKDRFYSQIMFNTLVDAYGTFKAEIKRRYEFDDFSEAVSIPGLVLAVEKIDKLLPRIQKKLPLDSNVDPLDLEVYVEALRNAFDELQTMAKEVDDEFLVKI